MTRRRTGTIPAHLSSALVSGRLVLGALVVGALVSGATGCGSDRAGEGNRAGNNGATNNGATNNGGTNNGATNNGAMNNGATNNGATNNGAMNNGAPLLDSRFLVGLSAGATSQYASLDLLGLRYDWKSSPYGTGDLVVAASAAHAFVTDRGVGSVVVFRRDNTLSIIGTINLAGQEPQGAVQAGGRVYVPIGASGRVSVSAVDALNADPSMIDLSALDVDGNPDAGAPLSDGDFVLVLLRHLDAGAPAANAQLLAIDSVSDSLIDTDPTTAEVDAMDLPGRDPQRLRWLPGGDLGVALPGVRGVPDGGVARIVRRDGGDYSNGGLLLDEGAFGGDIVDFVMVDAAVGVAIVVDGAASEAVVFDLTTDPPGMQPISGVGDPAGSGLETTPDRSWVLIGDRNAGVWVIDPSDHRVVMGPVDFGVPPTGIVNVTF